MLCEQIINVPAKEAVPIEHNEQLYVHFAHRLSMQALKKDIAESPPQDRQTTIDTKYATRVSFFASTLYT